MISTFGVEGGYRILDTFKVERQIADQVDYTFILTALRGLSSAYESQKLEETIEKIQAVALPNSEQASMILDFGVLKEKQAINEYLKILEKAIVENKTVKVTYTNAADQLGIYEIEPVAVVYKWFNWYLLAYSVEKEDYRLYKLVRMEHFWFGTLLALGDEVEVIQPRALKLRLRHKCLDIWK